MAHDHSHAHSEDDSHGKDHHDDGHGESDDAKRRQAVLNKLYRACILCSCFIVVEVVGGLMAHSLAVLSDAAHLFADLASFAVAIAASYLASLPATKQHTFGLQRTESLAALFSMVSLAFVSVGLAYEAIHRLWNPPDENVNGKFMSGIAAIGVVINILLAIVLGEDHVHMPGSTHSHGHGDHDDHGHDHSHGQKDGHGHGDTHASDADCSSYQHSSAEHDHDHHGHEHDHQQESMEAGHSHDHDHQAESTHDEDHPSESKALLSSSTTTTSSSDDHESSHQELDQRNVNLRAAYLHVMADLAQSVAVLIAGLVIWVRPDWHVIDPILTLLFAALVLYSTFGVLRSSIAVLLEETPPSVSWQQVYKAISSIPNVTDVHDLHIWCISHGQPTLTVHCSSNDPKALQNIHACCVRFGIFHSTIQVQTSEGPCISCGSKCCTGHLADTDDTHTH